MKILVLGDTHHPFANWQAITQAATFSKSYKPDMLIQMGDLFDAYNWSDYLKHPDAPNAEDEWSRTVRDVKRMQEMFSHVKRAVVLRGNHEDRIYRRFQMAGIPRAMMRQPHDFFAAPGWQWWTNDDPFIIDKIAFRHGHEESGTAVQKAKALGMSVVQGHDRGGYLEHIIVMGRQTFGVGAGAMCDLNAVSTRYGAKHMRKMWTGFLAITDRVPHLQPFVPKRSHHKRAA